MNIWRHRAEKASTLLANFLWRGTRAEPMENLFDGEQAKRLAAFLPQSVGTVIDVGAHTGEFALMIGTMFPDAKIYCFEPFPAAFRVLESRMRDFPGYRGFPFALGEKQGQAMMRWNAFTPSSSLLPFTWRGMRAFPYMALTRKRAVELRRLDEVLGAQSLPSPVLLKIDVQGYEDRVLAGATGILSAIDIVVLEVSFEPLFQGQLLADAMKRLLEVNGFTFAGYSLEMYSYARRKVVQADAVFLRSAVPVGVTDGKVAESQYR